MLGIIYANGKGVKKDISQAIEWYEKAATARSGISLQHIILQNIYSQYAKKAMNMRYERAKFWYEKGCR